MATDLAQQLFSRAFAMVRDPRSPAYKAGVLAALRYRCDGLRARCPYPMESAECDAWYAGTDEGHRRWREHASNRGQA